MMIMMTNTHTHVGLVSILLGKLS